MKRNLMTIFIGAVLVIVFVLLLFVFQVRQSETAVVATFGKPVATYTNAGAYFKWPWPIQKVYKYDNRIQNFEDRFSETLTHDQINLMTSVYVGWRISDPAIFLSRFPGDPANSIPRAQSFLENILRSSKSAVIGSNELSGIVNSDPRQLKFEAIERDIQSAVEGQLSTNNIGINIEFLGFKKIGLPESVTQTVFDRMKSERQNLISRNQANGDAQAMEIRSAAELEASKLISQANAKAIDIRSAGELEAANTYKVFQQNPELANFLLRVDAIKQALNQHTTLIFDQNQPPFDLFRMLPVAPKQGASASNNSSAK